MCNQTVLHGGISVRRTRQEFNHARLIGMDTDTRCTQRRPIWTTNCVMLMTNDDGIVFGRMCETYERGKGKFGVNLGQGFRWISNERKSARHSQ